MYKHRFPVCLYGDNPHSLQLSQNPGDLGLTFLVDSIETHCQMIFRVNSFIKQQASVSFAHIVVVVPERLWVIECLLGAVGGECKVSTTLTLQSLLVGPVGACESKSCLGHFTLGLHFIVQQCEGVMFSKIIHDQSWSQRLFFMKMF